MDTVTEAYITIADNLLMEQSEIQQLSYKPSLESIFIIINRWAVASADHFDTLRNANIPVQHMPANVGHAPINPPVNQAHYLALRALLHRSGISHHTPERLSAVCDVDKASWVQEPPNVDSHLQLYLPYQTANGLATYEQAADIRRALCTTKPAAQA